MIIEKLNNEKITAFDEKKNYELIKTLKNVLLTSLFSEIDIDIAFHIQLLIKIKILCKNTLKKKSNI